MKLFTQLFLIGCDLAVFYLFVQLLARLLPAH